MGLRIFICDVSRGCGRCGPGLRGAGPSDLTAQAALEPRVSGKRSRPAELAPCPPRGDSFVCFPGAATALPCPFPSCL